MCGGIVFLSDGELYGLPVLGPEGNVICIAALAARADVHFLHDGGHLQRLPDVGQVIHLRHRTVAVEGKENHNRQGAETRAPLLRKDQQRRDHYGQEHGAIDQCGLPVENVEIL